MHINSIEAYYEELPKLSKRARQIADFFYNNGYAGGYTDREVMNVLGYTEPNQVRPRITELIQLGILKEVGAVKCEITGKKVRKVLMEIG